MAKLESVNTVVVFCLLIAMALLAPPIQAGQVRTVNLEEMTSRAATIFSGRCVGVRHQRDEVLGVGVTLATFRVERAIKGDPDPTIEVRFLGSQTAGHKGPSGVPGFREGEDVVLFLYGTSDLGFASPVGLGQGKFSVVKDKKDQAFVVNEFSNANLTHGLSAEARQRLGESLSLLKNNNGLSANKLLDLTEKLLP